VQQRTRTLRDRIEKLSPAYFALVMATGIVSIASQQLSIPFVPQALFWINIAAYLTLCILNFLRIAPSPLRRKEESAT